MTLDIEAELKICEAATAVDDSCKFRGPFDFTPQERGESAKVWYDDGDCCAIVYDNLGIGASGDAMAEMFAHAVTGYPEALTRLKRIGELAKELDDRCVMESHLPGYWKHPPQDNLDEILRLCGVK